MHLKLHVDGGARGNPGPAAAGVFIEDDGGETLLEAGYLLGDMTNNQAEYNALILGIQAAARLGTGQLEIFSDSELMVKQIRGEYRVKSDLLRPLFEDVQRGLFQFDNWTIEHVPRELNTRADAVLNRALDQDEDVVETERVQVVARITTKGGKPTGSGGGQRTLMAAEDGCTAVWAKLLEDPKPGECPCGYQGEVQFVFSSRVPDGMCVHAANVLIEPVIRLREENDSASEDDLNVPTQISNLFCKCGAEFQAYVRWGDR